ncbi:hypothetical protein BLNAU_10950 [Blattamonas nauphoetae]|uniref:Uncharacterized protein n=1 Tax=Blattamonas nauphoetae TaxID=2049346 RepID=A0ABQ9XNY7_9EUKA|nr:hypothetical protein BLNAU_10950 [Blattamonas nauphoetae]
MEVEGVLSSGIVERLCTQLSSESGDMDLPPTLLVLDRLCSGLKETVETCQTNTTDQRSSNDDQFSLTRRCGFALTQIGKALLSLSQSLEKRKADETSRLQEKVGGVLVRHFSSSITSLSTKEIGAIGIDLAAVRREMEDKMRQMEEERRKEKEEFSRKMREMEEMKRMNEALIEEGRQRQEEKKREAERKREQEEEEERRKKMMKEGATAIEVFQQDKFTLAGNVFTINQSSENSLLSHSFGANVVRITFIIRSTSASLSFGVISADLTEQAKTAQDWFLRMKGGAGWDCLSSRRYACQNGKQSHNGSACIAGAVGQRVVIEADGREGKRTLKLSQDGLTQPAFFSNIPVPFRFVVHPYAAGTSFEIISTEVLRDAEMVGGSWEVVMD